MKKWFSTIGTSTLVVAAGIFLLFSVCSLSANAEQKAPIPDMQLVMVGNTLAAVDDISLSSLSKQSLSDEALVLEREILFRKLAESEVPAEKLPVLTTQPRPQFKPILSALSHQTFFDDLDREVIDPFRAMNNFENFMTRLIDHLKYSVGLYGEYDDNIFLDPDDKFSDHRLILDQNIIIQYPMDQFYLEAFYGVNLNFYGQADETTDIQNAQLRLSYYPFNKLSLAVTDRFLKVGESDIATAVEEQIINLGYFTNNVKTQIEYEIWKNGIFQIFHNYERVDFSDERSALPINRDVHTLNLFLKHYYIPLFSNTLGYRLKDVVFDDFAGKDQESHTLFYGLDYTLPRLLRFFGEIGYESKKFKNTEGELLLISPGGTVAVRGGSITIPPFTLSIPFEERREHDNNVNFLVGIESILSRYNRINLTYSSRILESARSEFTQYLDKVFAVNSQYYLNRKTILFLSSYLQVQSFDAKDSFDLFFADGDATTKINSFGMTLRRLLTDQLYFDVGYTYVRRTTDFPGEASNNSRFRFGARATF